MAVMPANGYINPELGDNEVAVQHRRSRAAVILNNDGVTYAVDKLKEVITITDSGRVTILQLHRIKAISYRFGNFVEEADNFMTENECESLNEFLTYASCGEKCAGALCHVCACELCSCKLSKILGPDQILSGPLKKARNLGMKFFFVDGLIFPLLNHIVRDLVVSGELLYTIVGLILSIINYIKADCDQVFNLVNFVIGIIAALLGIASSIQALYRRNIFRTKAKSDSGTALTTQVIDISRTVAAEILIYPLLICSIFSIVTSRPFETRTANDIVGLVRFAISAASFIAFVYILRIMIIAGSMLKLRSITGTTYYFMVYFLIHVTLQMVVQAFMIVVTGREIYEENLHFYNVSNSSFNFTDPDSELSDDSCFPVMVSPTLWYMIIATYVLPIFGTVMFFIVGYYWTQTFFIRIFISNFKIVKTPGLVTAINLGKETSELAGKLESYLPKFEGKIQSDFKKLDGVCFCTKFGHAFKSPALVIVCIVFLVLNYFFISFGADHDIFAALGPFAFFHALSDFAASWSPVYFAGAIVGIFANFPSFLVGIAWLVLIEIIIFLLPFIIICICCVGAICA